MPDTQYFTNIDGKYVKDAEARQQLNDLEDYVESLDQPWQPLEDGYSNFWLELTEDTLSPWLNFSAKNNNATIDWGDGSGEVALDTLTPTHTYSKAGKYVVKVKGVTEIARQNVFPFSGKYLDVLTNIELNDEVTTFASNAFAYETGLRNFVAHGTLTSVGTYAFAYSSSLNSIAINYNNDMSNYAFYYDYSLTDIAITGTTGYGSSCWGNCVSLTEITIPSTVTSIGERAFRYCQSLSEIHIESTTPATLGNEVFAGIQEDYIIYVPVGYAETYKAASGWSAYADHILEEGQTPTRAMMAKFNAMKTDEPQDDMR